MLGENETPWHISPWDEGSHQQGQQTSKQLHLSPGALFFQWEEKLEPLLEDPPEAAAPQQGQPAFCGPTMVFALCSLPTCSLLQSQANFTIDVADVCACSPPAVEDLVCSVNRGLMDFSVSNHTFLGAFPC